MLRHVPNALTCSNLICGMLGILMIDTIEPIWFLGIACVFDFLDGFAARMLKVSSPIGKELDSIADMVTFGVLPAVYWFHLINHPVLSYVAILIAVFSAIRLAKFNVDPRQVEGFIGVPTPANALFLTTFPFLFAERNVMPEIAIPVILLFCWFMVSPFEMFGLKFKNFKWAGNELRFTFLGAAVLLIGFFQVAGIALTIILYILASLVSSRGRTR
jgi:CDP-diacylglycerol--serine O-phosphatidyltransferase